MSLFSIIKNIQLRKASLLLLLNLKFNDTVSLFSYLIYLGQVLLYIYTDETGKSGNSARRSGAKTTDRVVSRTNASIGMLCQALIDIRNSIVHYDADTFYMSIAAITQYLDYNLYPIPRRLQPFVLFLKLIDLDKLTVYWSDMKLPSSLDDIVYVNKYYNRIPEYYRSKYSYLDKGAVVLNYFKEHPEATRLP